MPRSTPPRMNVPPLSEHQIQNQIQSYLWMKGFFVMRLNSGRIPMTDKYGKKRIIQMAEPGTPDLMAFRPRHKMPNAAASDQGIQLIFVEVKAGRNKPTIFQENKMHDLTRYGAYCVVAYSIEDLQKLGI